MDDTKPVGNHQQVRKADFAQFLVGFWYYSLSDPQKAQEPTDLRQCSLWSLRRRIRALGWTDAKTGRLASVESKRFNPKNEFADYYAILLCSFSVGKAARLLKFEPIAIINVLRRALKLCLPN